MASAGGNVGALRELLALFEIRVDEHELKEAHEHIDSFVARLGRVSTIVAEAFAVHAVKEFFAEQVEGAAHLQDLAERLDVSAGELRAFGFAAKAAGIDVDSAAHALGFLQKNMGAALLGEKEQSQTFAKLGLTLKDSAGHARPLLDVAGDLADSFEKLPDQTTRAAYAMKVFGREGRVLLPVFAKGREALAEMFKEAEELGNGLGDDFYKNAKRVREEFEHWQYALNSLKDRALAAAMPWLLRLGRWLKEHTKTLIEFTKRTNVLTTSMEFLAIVAGVKLLRTLIALARTFGLLKGGILATLRSLAGFAAPIAIITALYLLFDDLWTLMNGGRSVIGTLLDKFYGLGAAKKFADEIRGAWSDVKGLFDGIGDALDKLTESEGKVSQDWRKGALDEIIEDFRTFLEVLKDVLGTIQNIIGAMNQLKHGRILDALAHLIERNPDATYDETGGQLRLPGQRGRPPPKLGSAFNPVPPQFVGPLQELTPEDLGFPADFTGPLPPPVVQVAPQAVETPGTGTGVRQVVQNNTFHTNVRTGSGDPKAIGAAVGTGLATTAEKAAQNALAAQVQP